MYYTTLFRNSYKSKEEITWMGKTFNNKKDAFNYGCNECEKLYENMPNIKFTIVMHHKMWLELDIESK